MFSSALPEAELYLACFQGSVVNPPQRSEYIFDELGDRHNELVRIHIKDPEDICAIAGWTPDSNSFCIDFEVNGQAAVEVNLEDGHIFEVLLSDIANHLRPLVDQICAPHYGRDEWQHQSAT
jgi:hypothetical protein